MYKKDCEDNSELQNHTELSNRHQLADRSDVFMFPPRSRQWPPAPLCTRTAGPYWMGVYKCEAQQHQLRTLRLASSWTHRLDVVI